MTTERGSLVGSLVAGHELVRVIATGSMGEVYLAQHPALGLSRVVKVIRADLRTRAQSLARFMREAQVLVRLHHESIVEVVEFGSLDNGWPYLLMEYVEGPNLDEVVHEQPLALGPALQILEQLALALHYAHESNVIHRDLKPANILLRDGDPRQVKLIDFGLARVADPDVERITGKDETIGSPIYMAPEQADGGHDVTPAADIYALAGIAYTLLSGSPPFTHKAAVRLIAAHATETPPRLTERRPELPPLLDDLLAACLAKDPSHRPNGEQLATALRRVRDVAGSMSAPPAPPPRVAKLVLDAPGDFEGRRLALANRIMDLVEEIATHLSHTNPELLALLRLESGIREQLTGRQRDLESAVAALERNAGDSSLLKQCDALHEQIRTLNAQQLPLQRRMIEVVEAHRPDATGSIKALFAQIDQALDELELLSTGN